MTHFFPLPRELFTIGLSVNEIAIYAYLMSIENRKTYQCWASYATIGKAVSLSENTVRKYVQLLEKKHLIHTEHTKVKTKDGRTHNGCLLYAICPFDDAMNVHMENQFTQLEIELEAHKAKERVEKYNRKHPENLICATFTDGVG